MRETFINYKSESNAVQHNVVAVASTSIWYRINELKSSTLLLLLL